MNVLIPKSVRKDVLDQPNEGLDQQYATYKKEEDGI